MVTEPRIQLPPDRYDNVRREWIAFYQGPWTIQRARAEQLGRIIRMRQRIQTSSVPDPHDDTRLSHFLLRERKSKESHIEFFVVLASALIAPIGWPAGWALKTVVTKQIPHTLRGFPIAMFIWVGVGLGLLTLAISSLMYDPAGSFGQIAVLPWVCLQVAAAPTIAGIYGILEGWLAVSASRQWWPLTPPARPLTTEDAAEVLGGYDLTGPGIVDAAPLNKPGDRKLP